MYPEVEDNYGTESCSVLIFPSMPPLIVIANSLGTLYHCLMMPSDDEDEQKADQTTTYLDYDIFVVEIIELELGMQLAECNSVGPQDICPLHMMKDDSNSDRYLVSHNAGVHAITVTLVEQLKDYLEVDENAHLHLPNLNTQSVAEYLLCTKVEGINKSSDCPVLGLSIIGSPPTLVVLLASGEVVSLQLTSVPFTYGPSSEIQITEDGETKSPLKEMLREPFDAKIRRCLKPDLTQPIIKLGPEAKNNLSPRQCFEMLTRATTVLREQYFPRHDLARQEIQKRVRMLQLIKQNQLAELMRLDTDKFALKSEAERLAEMCEDIQEKQISLSKRAEMLLRLVIQKSPKVSPAEKEFCDKVKESQEKMKTLNAKLVRAKNNMRYQTVQIDQWKSQNKSQDINLNEQLTTTIKASLQARTAEITQIIKDVNVLRNALEVS